MGKVFKDVLIFSEREIRKVGLFRRFRERKEVGFGVFGLFVIILDGYRFRRGMVLFLGLIVLVELNLFLLNKLDFFRVD